jgi:hypothetical protein
MSMKYVCEMGCPNIVEDETGICTNCGSSLIPKDESEIPLEWLNPASSQDSVVPLIPMIVVPDLPKIIAVTVSEGTKSIDFLPGEYTIGRADVSNFVVCDESVSRNHLTLGITEDVVTLTVLPTTTNRSITVNGTLTGDPTAPIELPLGTSEVKIGESTTLIISTTTA